MLYELNEKVFHVKTECVGAIIEKDTRNKSYYVDFGTFGKWCAEDEIKYVDSGDFDLINKGKNHD